MAFFRSTLFLCLIFLTGYSTLHAQLLNVERIRTFADSTGWHGDLGFDLSVNKYNDRIFKLGNQANAAYYSNLHSYVFLTNLEIINVDGASLVSSGYAHLRGVFYRERTLSPELFIQHQYNNNLGLRGRALAGAGVRYTFLSRDAITGRFSTALMQEYENWRLSGEEAIENNFLKSTNNISMRGRLSDQTSLLLIGYYQARPSRFFEPRVTLENQLNIRMSRWVLFSVSFVLTHDANPVIDIPKLTYELKNGILISF
ncbi:MAG: DUF481 domain-containing protein [Balneolaceae bacterium]|nr:DUF481 domain-containing protein [Balneolaceae bacterium]